MKVLILSIYHDTPIYRQMCSLQTKYINEVMSKNIDYYFVTFRSEQEELVVREDNFLYVKGTETYLGITDKTLKALKYSLEMTSYDYIIRTNVSTIILFPCLTSLLRTLPKNEVYMGGILITLNWLDFKAGINETTIQTLSLRGLKYIQGTSIILSKDTAEFILQHRSLINDELVDDVSIGLFIRNHLPHIYDKLKSSGKASFNKK